MKYLTPAAMLVLAWLVVIGILLTPEPPGGYSLVHPKFSAMDQGGPGELRHNQIFKLGCCFGALVIAGLVGLLGWSLKCHLPGNTKRLLTFLSGGLVYEVIFVWICLTYQQTWSSPADPAFLGPFPAAASGLLFGIFAVPWLFILVYVVSFHGWVSEIDQEKKLSKLLGSLPK